MSTCEEEVLRPEQTQVRQPGLESEMIPVPQTELAAQPGGKLEGKVALITGGDSGIGRAVAVAFAKAGADIAIVYRDEHTDALATQSMIESLGRKFLSIACDIGQEENCKAVVATTIEKLERIDILVNNAAEQHVKEDILEITADQLERTFRTNFYSYFFMTREALPHLRKGSAIINTTSVTAYRGSAHLVDYAATKGAIVAFTRSLALQLAAKGIRVNAVAPGPIWTPLIPSTFEKEDVATFGSKVPLGRAGEPAEVAPSFLFLASDDSTFMTGQVLHPNGGEIING